MTPTEERIPRSVPQEGGGGRRRATLVLECLPPAWYGQLVALSLVDVGRTAWCRRDYLVPFELESTTDPKTFPTRQQIYRQNYGQKIDPPNKQ